MDDLIGRKPPASARKDEAARRLSSGAEGRRKDSRALDSVDLADADQLSVKNGIEIPHNAVRLEDGSLRSDLAATDFVKVMTHELRTPLNVIIGLCQLLERDRKSRLSPMQHDAVNRMERNARTLLQSVNHLLTYLRTGECD